MIWKGSIQMPEETEVRNLDYGEGSSN